MRGRGARIAFVATLAGWMVLASGCQETGKTQASATAGGAAAGAPTPATDFFSCGSASDCVVENQKDCCPCNAGGRQVALRKKSLDAFRAARAARCAGDLLCPQVYLCDDTATALCLAGKCALGHGGGPVPPR